MLAHRRGQISQKKGARLLGIRKDEFAALASEWACRQIVEAHRHTEAKRALRDFIARFNRTFPECDPNAYYRPPEPPRCTDPLFRSYVPAKVIRYSASELEGLTPSQPKLAGAHDLTGTEGDPVLVIFKVGRFRSPATSRNRLRVSEPESFLDPMPLDFSGGEFTHAVRGGQS